MGDKLIAVGAETHHAVRFPGPFSLDDISRSVLGLPECGPDGPYLSLAGLRAEAEAVVGDAGPVSELIIPTFDGSLKSPKSRSLTAREAMEVLLGSVMNLSRCGDNGWTTLCQLVARIPMLCVAHRDAPTFAKDAMNQAPKNSAL